MLTGSWQDPAIGLVLRYVEWLLAGSIPILLGASQHNTCLYQLLFVYRVDPPDDEQQACSKHVETYY
jgi:hypothetical protein